MKVSFSKSATTEVDRIATKLRDEAGDRIANIFLVPVESRISMLTDFPRSSTLVGREATRRYPVTGFPYLIFYRPIGDDELRIIRIRHARRRPLTWL